MNKVTRAIMVAAAAASLFALAAAPARADQSPERIWKNAIHRLNSLRHYSLGYNYEGPKGPHVFTYAAIRTPAAVKTYIVKGDNAGATLIYNPEEYKGNQVVYARKKGIPVAISIGLNDARVKGTPIIKPVYDMLLDDVKASAGATYKGTDTVNGHTVYVFAVNGVGGAHEVAVDKATSDVLRWKSPDGATRTFYDINTTARPRIDF